MPLLRMHLCLGPIPETVSAMEHIDITKQLSLCWVTNQHQHCVSSKGALYNPPFYASL